MTLHATRRRIFGNGFALFWAGTTQFYSACGTRSAAADAGWRRVCPACTHFISHRSGGDLLIVSGDDVLVGRSPGGPEGMYSLLAGSVEPGET
jgi:NAD+ diphosphatase